MTMPDLPRAFHLPRNVPEPPLETRQFHKLTALVPKLDAEFIKLVCARLKENRRALLTFPTSRVVKAVARAGDDLMRGMLASSRFDAELGRMRLATGIDTNAIHQGIHVAARWLKTSRMLPWIEGEIGPIQSLGSRARGPAVMFQSLAGNVPYPAMMAIACGLLARSGTLIKSAAAEPVFPTLFAGLIAAADPEIGDCVAVLPWTGGEVEIEDSALCSAGLVVAYGSDNTIAELRRRTPVSARFIEHPHRFSIGFVAATVDQLTAAERTKWDVVRFDLSGCLSPQTIFVEGTAEAFSDKLCEELRRYEAYRADRNEPIDRLPADFGAIRRSREKAEFAELAGRGVRLLASENLDWTIVVQERPLRPFQLFNRVVNVVGIDHYREIAGLLGESAKSLSCVGVSVTPDRRDEVVDFLVELGAKRICPLGQMQTPPLAWHHDGRFHLADFLEWTDVEI